MYKPATIYAVYAVRIHTMGADICDTQSSRPEEVSTGYHVFRCTILNEFTMLTLHLLVDILNVRINSSVRKIKL